ncbi:Gfo/Idh/MocA family protein [Flexithrix dorotheae]|uniref:Gfo/Idh/MocA family protein n=1 Tax=Flexithrix dorotheae TaxID=70993 RepID=UPI00037A2035|nr:Gfo/Idh/MocA family oxidoreductase [Flexithrix dorotheae]
MKNSRRKFLHHSGLAIAGSSLAFPHILSAKNWKVAPSDQVNVGLIGCRQRGFAVLKDHLTMPEVNCVAICDVDENVLNEKKAELKDKYNQDPKVYLDFRKLLEQKDIDAVIIGTPDHWHCLPSVYACQAGKDVYVEKPMANSIAECDLMVAAANKYNRIVQVGQQQRSGEVWNAAMKEIWSGKLGKLRRANIWANFNYGLGPKKVSDTPAPNGVDYDFWLGPAATLPFNDSRFHGSWRFFWDYGGGLMTDWGVHLIDMALWARKIETPPKSVLASGTHGEFSDRSTETFNTMSVLFPMEDDYLIQWEHTAGTQNGPYGRLYGIAFVGENGTLVADRRGWEIYPEWDNAKKANKIEESKFNSEANSTVLHAQDFVNCIKTREQPSCNAEVGRNVALYAHFANIALRSGAYKLNWDVGKGKFDHKAANKFITPKYRSPWELPKAV